MTSSDLRNLIYQSLLDLSTDEGINASGKTEVYGCIFGRDSALTILKILKSHTKSSQLKLLEISRRALLTLVSLQGKEFNIESGEQPGKFIHEFRREKFEHLISSDRPWFVYPDGLLRNYDSIDSTPLTLIAIYKYWQVTQDNEFLVQVLPAVEAGLNWIITFGDMDKDDLLEYDFPATRTHGGLLVQSWTDSHESIRQADGQMPEYPIAPVEVQAYAWLAMRLWADYYKTSSLDFAQKLLSEANKLKKIFNKKFIFMDQGKYFLAQALDGDKNQIRTVTGNPFLCLWAAFVVGNQVESIVDSRVVDSMVKRAFKDDLFDKDAGIRTMSTLSDTFNPGEDSYHNGSFWPILNGLAIEGLENFGFRREARKLRLATLKPIKYFKTPIELYIKHVDGSYLEYRNSSGQTSCKVQAWSAAATLDLLT